MLRTVPRGGYIWLIERSDRAPGNGPRALFFTCLLGDRPRRPGGCSTRPAPPSWPRSRPSNEAAPFPTQFPARWESAGVGFPEMRSLADLSLFGTARWESTGVGFSDQAGAPSRPRVEALDRGRPSTRRYRTRPGRVAPGPRASIRVSAHDRPNLSETNSRGSIRFRPTGRRATERGEPRLRGRPALSLFT